ncbi:MAG: PDZ domain-containing protein, partial [Candidatus Omnitrophota bacterium]
EMKWEGAIVESVQAGGGAERSGIKIKDHIVAINRESIRYTPLKTILSRLRRNKNRIVTVQRKINVFK